MGKGGLTEITCEHCGARAMKLTGGVNRSRRKGAALYCSRECSSFARRSGKTTQQRRAEKAEYDRRRRAELGEELLAQKRAAYHALSPQEKTNKYLRKKAKRQANPEIMRRYEEACRRARNRPEWKAHKRRYDRRYRAEQEFGEGALADAVVFLRELQDEVNDRIERDSGFYYHQKGRSNAQKRRRKCPIQAMS